MFHRETRRSIENYKANFTPLQINIPIPPTLLRLNGDTCFYYSHRHTAITPNDTPQKSLYLNTHCIDSKTGRLAIFDVVVDHDCL